MKGIAAVVTNGRGSVCLTVCRGLARGSALNIMHRKQAALVKHTQHWKC